MIALIPVAGYATRLYPLTKKTPKTLLDIGGKPMLERVLQKVLELNGLAQIVIVSNHVFFSQIQDWAKAFQKNCPVPILVLNDHTTSNDNRLGAMGDAQFAIEHAAINDDIVWVSGDNLFTFSLIPMQKRFVEQRHDLIGCFDVKTSHEAAKMGVVTLNSNSQVVNFVEKPSAPQSTLISCGIYFYTKQTVHDIKTYLSEKNSPDKPGDFVAWLYQKKPVFGFAFDRDGDEWFDIGTLDVYEQVRQNWK